MNKLKELIVEWDSLRGQKEGLEAQLTEINKRIEILARQEIPSAMDDAGVQNIKLDGIGRVSLRGDLFASIVADSREGAYEWLEATGRGSLIKPTVKASTLKAAIKAWMADGEEIPEEFFKVTPYTQATLTKA